MALNGTLPTARDPAISIIIPHRDDHAGLNRTLAALAALDPQSPSFEVIVADNRSLGGLAVTAEAVRRSYAALAPRLRLIDAPEPGAGPARNAGAAVARGARLVFLDCDCLPPPGWLCAVAAALDGGPIAGGPVTVVPPPGSPAPLNAVQAFDLLFGFNVPASFRRDGLLLTANLAVRAPDFRAVGLFRQGVSEDMEWCDRARSIGYRPALDPAMALGHVAIDHEQRLIARWDRITRESWCYARERGRGRAAWLLYSAMVATSPLVHAPRALVAPLGPEAGPALRLALLALLCRIRWRRAMLGLRLMQA